MKACAGSRSSPREDHRKGIWQGRLAQRIYAVAQTKRAARRAMIRVVAVEFARKAHNSARCRSAIASGDLIAPSESVQLNHFGPSGAKRWRSYVALLFCDKTFNMHVTTAWMFEKSNRGFTMALGPSLAAVKISTIWWKRRSSFFDVHNAPC